MDLDLFGPNSGKTEEEVSRETGLSAKHVRRAYSDILGERRSTLNLQWKALLLDPVPEITGNGG